VVVVKKCLCCWAPLSHAYNPSYSGGRAQEDLGSKSTLANSLRDPIWKIPNTKNRAGGMAQAVVRPYVQNPVPPKKMPLLLKKM
jgi:hypothetical protein